MPYSDHDEETSVSEYICITIAFIVGALTVIYIIFGGVNLIKSFF